MIIAVSVQIITISKGKMENGKMKIIILIMVMALCSSLKANNLAKNKVFNSSLTESNYKKNTAIFQLLGSTLIYNITYDRIVFKKGIHNISLSIGGEYLNIPVMKYNLYLTPQLNYFIGAKKSFILLGIGTLYSYSNSMAKFGNEIIANVDISYRYQQQEGGLFCQAGLYLKRALSKEYPKVSLWPGISIGYTF